MYIPADRDKLPKGTEKAWIDSIPCKVKMQIAIKISSQFSPEGAPGEWGYSDWSFPFATVFTACSSVQKCWLKLFHVQWHRNVRKKSASIAASDSSAADKAKISH